MRSPWGKIACSHIHADLIKEGSLKAQKDCMGTETETGVGLHRQELLKIASYHQCQKEVWG